MRWKDTGQKYRYNIHAVINSTYFFQKRIAPFCKSLLLNMNSFLLQNLNSSFFKLGGWIFWRWPGVTTAVRFSPGRFSICSIRFGRATRVPPTRTSPVSTIIWAPRCHDFRFSRRTKIYVPKWWQKKYNKGKIIGLNPELFKFITFNQQERWQPSLSKFSWLHLIFKSYKPEMNYIYL